MDLGLLIGLIFFCTFIFLVFGDRFTKKGRQSHKAHQFLINNSEDYEREYKASGEQSEYVKQAQAQVIAQIDMQNSETIPAPTTKAKSGMELSDADDFDIENLKLELYANKKLFVPTKELKLYIAPEYKSFGGSEKPADPQLVIDILMKRGIFPENISAAHSIAFVMFASERLSFYFETWLIGEENSSMQMQYYEECFFKYCQFLEIRDSRVEVNKIIQKERNF